MLSLSQLINIDQSFIWGCHQILLIISECIFMVNQILGLLVDHKIHSLTADRLKPCGDHTIKLYTPFQLSKPPLRPVWYNHVCIIIPVLTFYNVSTTRMSFRILVYLRQSLQKTPNCVTIISTSYHNTMSSIIYKLFVIPHFVECCWMQKWIQIGLEIIRNYIWIDIIWISNRINFDLI